MPKLPKGRGRVKPKIKDNTSWGGDTSFYRTTRWKKLRAWFKQHNPICVECVKEGRVKEMDVVDHIIPIKQGGAEYELSNLQALCHSCHNSKTAKENRK